MKRDYTNNDDCPCAFIRKSLKGSCIISVHANGLNIIGSAEDIEEAMASLKKELEMKDLGKNQVLLRPAARAPP